MFILVDFIIEISNTVFTSSTQIAAMMDSEVRIREVSLTFSVGALTAALSYLELGNSKLGLQMECTVTPRSHFVTQDD